MKSSVPASPLLGTFATCAAAVAIHLGLLFQVLKPLSSAALMFIPIVAAPCLVISAVAWWLNRRAASRFCGQGLAATYLVFGSWAYCDALYIHPDPQNGLIFVVVPILAVLVTGVATAIMLVTLPPSRGSGAEGRDA
jgi:hypothetical protein